MTTTPSNMTNSYLTYTIKETTPGEEVFVFGDFTEKECDILAKTSTITTPSKSRTSVSTGKNISVIFGDFTPAECAKIQLGLHLHLQEETTTQVQQPSPTYNNNTYYNSPCSRCGYHSHTVDRCVARRNRYGELIHMYTSNKQRPINIFSVSPPLSPPGPVYYNTHLINNRWCSDDKTNYMQFKFTEEHIQELVEDQSEDANLVDYLYYEGQYMAVYKVYDYSCGQVGYNLRPAGDAVIKPDPEIEGALRYNYAQAYQMLSF
jgi:hypothetical protein